MPYIYILPIDTSPAFKIDSLKAGIRACFNQPVRSIQSQIDLKQMFDFSRQQYNCSSILLQVISQPPPDALKILGVVEVDLFIPILTFLFGEAQLGGIGAVVSLHRLNNKFYGLPENPQLLSQRLLKEAIHELGHTFGLMHCSTGNCVMNSSTYVEDIDQKSDQFCIRCQQGIKLR